LSVVHQQLFNQEWGTIDYNQDTTNNFIDGQSYKVIIPFSHFKYERLLNQANSAITSIQWGWSVNENQEAYKDKPLVFYPIRKSGDNVSYLNPNNQDEGIVNYNIPSNSRFTNDTLTKIKAKLPLNILLNFELNDKFRISGIDYRINSITTNLITGDADIELLNV